MGFQVGSIPGWIGKCCHGDNEEDVYRQLCQILDEWIEIYEGDNVPLPPSISGKKYSGKFQLRVDSDLHKALSIRAMQMNESLNKFCGRILRKGISNSDISRDKKIYDKGMIRYPSRRFLLRNADN